MWWLDDSLYQGNSGDRRRLLYRCSLLLPKEKPPVEPQFGNTVWELSEAQNVVNKALMETNSDQQSQEQRLLADIASLENAVRQHAEQRTELETRLQRQATEHEKVLGETIAESQLTLQKQKTASDAHAQQLREHLVAAEKQLSETEKRSAKQAALASTSTENANQLRELLAEAEHTIRSRDDELSDLKSRLDEGQREHTDRMAEAKHRHTAEAEQLRAIASSAEWRAIEHKGQITRLEAELASQRKNHSAEFEQLRASFASKLGSSKMELSDASNQVQAQAEEIAKLVSDAQRLQEENESCRQQLQSAADARTTAQYELNQIIEQHSQEQLDLKSKIDRLQSGLDSVSADKDALSKDKAALLENMVAVETAAKRATAKQLTVIKKLKQQLATSTSDSQQSDQRFQELQQKSVELQATIDGLRNSAAERESQKGAEIAALQKKIKQFQDATDQQTHRTGRIESVLRAQRHTLGRRIERLNSEAAERRTEHCSEIITLQKTIKDLRSQLGMLAEQAEQSSRELDRNHGTLQRVQSKSERILEIHDSHLNTLQSRIDQLVFELDIETQKRKAATEEARRLGDARSGRLGFLAQQRLQLQADMQHLKGENERLRGEETRLRQTLKSTDWSLTKATNGLRAQAGKINQLRSQLDAAIAEQTQKQQQDTDWHTASTREIRRLSVLLDQTKVELQECRKQLVQQPPEEDLEGTDHALAERDRAIALLNQEAFEMRERLHREAAARRKAEGAIKREAQTEDMAPSMNDAWAQIDAREQVGRFKRQIAALENIGRLERQRAAAEISRYKKLVKQLQQQSDNRAA